MFRSTSKHFPLLAPFVALACFSVSLIVSPSTRTFAQEPAVETPQAGETETENKNPGDQTSKDAASETIDLKTPPSDPGQDDLDEAAILRFDAKSARELQAVERLLQSAIKKGLSGENASFGKKMLGSVLLQKSQQLIAAMGQPGLTPNRAIGLRDEALKTLDEAVVNDPGLVEAYLLVARLNLLPGGDKDAITEATT
ncbi:MAG: hypothetical protein KDB00_15075, partial [Planctomycetales bacterium]|nr:hypothetical protein [Planctomycetales bacterium]